MGPTRLIRIAVMPLALALTLTLPLLGFSPAATGAPVTRHLVSSAVKIEIPFALWPCSCDKRSFDPQQIRSQSSNPNAAYHRDQYQNVDSALFQYRDVPLNIGSQTIHQTWLATRYAGSENASDSLDDATSNLDGQGNSQQGCTDQNNQAVSNCAIYLLSLRDGDGNPTSYVLYAIFAIGATVGEVNQHYTLAQYDDSHIQAALDRDFFLLLSAALSAVRAGGSGINQGAWPSPESMNARLSAAQADSVKINPIPSPLRNQTYAKSGMTAGVLEREVLAVGPGNLYSGIWLGSLYSSAAKAAARYQRIETYLGSGSFRGSCSKPSGKSGATPSCAFWQLPPGTRGISNGVLYGIFAVGNTVGEVAVLGSPADFSNSSRLQILKKAFRSLLTGGLEAEYQANGLQVP
ncbi:MAG TPA: hypothetical protein VFB34_04465 [Chloroflexota bacterium]|nr:hypothetical protein [Chloroflexota bacterium]